MRLPNNYGTVYKLSGRRSRPWIARKLFNGRYQTIGYFKTRTEGVSALADAQRKESGDVIFTELYDVWLNDKFSASEQTCKNNLYRAYTASYKHCSKIYSKR